MSREAPDWLQGCVIAGDSVISDQVEFLKEAPFWMVTTHSCSIYHQQCELLELMPFSAEDFSGGQHGLLRNGRNPREFFLETEWTDAAKPKPKKGLRFNQTRRCWISKAAVMAYRAEQLHHGLVVPPEDIKRLITWLSNSYTRAALPASFERAARPIMDVLRAFLSGPNEEMVSRVYFDLVPATEELQPPATYTLEIILVPEAGVSGDVLKSHLPPELSAVADFCTDVLQYAGVNPIELHAVTIVDAEQWVWWDHMDYLTSPPT